MASNFERYLYYRVGADAAALRSLMQAFARDGRLPVERLSAAPDGLMAAGSGTTEATLATIRTFYRDHRYLLDPHSAVGVFVGRRHLSPDEPMICLATAHPAKFAQALSDATGEDVARHPALDRLRNLPTRCALLPASPDAVRRHVEAHIGG